MRPSSWLPVVLHRLHLCFYCIRYQTFDHVINATRYDIMLYDITFLSSYVCNLDPGAHMIIAFGFPLFFGKSGVTEVVSELCRLQDVSLV